MARKLVAPVVVVALFVLYLAGFCVFALSLPAELFWLKLLGLLIPLIVAGCAVAVLIARIREIKSGAEDDLDRY